MDVRIDETRQQELVSLLDALDLRDHAIGDCESGRENMPMMDIDKVMGNGKFHGQEFQFWNWLVSVCGSVVGQA